MDDLGVPPCWETSKCAQVNCGSYLPRPKTNKVLTVTLLARHPPPDSHEAPGNSCQFNPFRNCPFPNSGLHPSAPWGILFGRQANAGLKPWEKAACRMSLELWELSSSWLPGSRMCKPTDTGASVVVAAELKNLPHQGRFLIEAFEDTWGLRFCHWPAIGSS